MKYILLSATLFFSIGVLMSLNLRKQETEVRDSSKNSAGSQKTVEENEETVPKVYEISVEFK